MKKETRTQSNKELDLNKKSIARFNIGIESMARTTSTVSWSLTTNGNGC
ncbi:MAG: hypothetical protein ACEPOV_02850 [Hyphomicrobiales bacterium]